MASAPAAVETWPDLPERDGYEYVDGTWVKIPTGAQSVWVSSQLFVQLHKYARRRRTGVALAHATSFQIWPAKPRRYRKPDGAFIATGRLPNNRVPEMHINAVPELVIEVCAPDDLAEAIEGKLGEYRDAGIPLIWAIYPKGPRAYVFRRNRTGRIVEEDEYLEGEDVLPGFRVRLRDLLQPKGLGVSSRSSPPR